MDRTTIKYHKVEGGIIITRGFWRYYNSKQHMRNFSPDHVTEMELSILKDKERMLMQICLCRRLFDNMTVCSWKLYHRLA